MSVVCLQNLFDWLTQISKLADNAFLSMPSASAAQRSQYRYRGTILPPTPATCREIDTTTRYCILAFGIFMTLQVHAEPQYWRQQCGA